MTCLKNVSSQSFFIVVGIKCFGIFDYLCIKINKTFIKQSQNDE